MSDTPRTDAENKRYALGTVGLEFVTADFARTLEREVIEANKEMAIITNDRNGLMAINEKHRLALGKWKQCAAWLAVVAEFAVASADIGTTSHAKRKSEALDCLNQLKNENTHKTT